MERVDDDDNTEPQILSAPPASCACTRCAARVSIDEAIVRSGAERVTIVSTYSRPRFGQCAVENTKALVCFAGGVIAKGEGHSREDAIEDALRNAGVKV